mmetsp:Transcript_95935/g.298210  ORF Transcript_95935/g.298210 Transcript_95935/m.298210 type:complete len:111 (+) Transcript_95935:772-1104(+)
MVVSAERKTSDPLHTITGGPAGLHTDQCNWQHVQMVHEELRCKCMNPEDCARAPAWIEESCGFFIQRFPRVRGPFWIDQQRTPLLIGAQEDLCGAWTPSAALLSWAHASS